MKIIVYYLGAIYLVWCAITGRYRALAPHASLPHALVIAMLGAPEIAAMSPLQRQQYLTHIVPPPTVNDLQQQYIIGIIDIEEFSCAVLQALKEEPSEV